MADEKGYGGRYRVLKRFSRQREEPHRFIFASPDVLTQLEIYDETTTITRFVYTPRKRCEFTLYPNKDGTTYRTEGDDPHFTVDELLTLIEKNIIVQI